MSLRKTKVAFFDFCNTIVKINTLSRFVDFTINYPAVNHKNIRRFTFKSRRFLSKSRLFSSRAVELKCLSGIDKELLSKVGKDFYDQIIVQNFNKDTVEWVHKLKNQDYKIIILSAALSIYLKFITNSLPVDLTISTELLYNKRGGCLGKIDGIDTVGIGKLEKLKNSFNDYEKIDFKNSCFFTDDPISDRPVLELVGNAVLVMNNNQTKTSIKFLSGHKIYS